MEIEAKKSVIIPEGVFIIATYDENDVPNAMNAAWGVQSDYEQISFYLAEHKTTDNLKIHKAFTVSFGTKKTIDICDYFGIESGHNINKIDKAKVHIKTSEHVHAPIILEFPLTLECEMISFDEEKGILTGKIISSQADENILSDGRVDLDKLEPIIYDPSIHAYRIIGEVVGHAFKDGLKIKNS